MYSRRQLDAIATIHRRFGSLRGSFRERVGDFAFSVSLVFDDVDRAGANDIDTMVKCAVILGREELLDVLRPVHRGLRVIDATPLPENEDASSQSFAAQKT